MAFVVSRKDGRYEIRESVHTPVGPRARTLATFTHLTARVLSDARHRACRSFDEARIRARAAQLGAKRREMAGVTAQALVWQLRAGETIPPILAQQLRPLLAEVEAEVPNTIGDAVDWIGTSDACRGNVLVQLMQLGDAFPDTRKPGDRSLFPRISSGM